MPSLAYALNRCSNKSSIILFRNSKRIMADKLSISGRDRLLEKLNLLLTGCLENQEVTVNGVK